MVLFRLICAIFLAWAMNWAFSRPAALPLLEEMPETAFIAPLAGAIVGAINLARRQGWGLVVAIANGIWAGVLAVFVTAVLLLGAGLLDTARIGDVDFEFAADRFSETVALLVDLMGVPGFLVLCIGAGALVGVITEIIHWALVRLRRNRGLKDRNTRRAHRPSMY
ncbi:MAG: hypothetical protein AAGC57_09875 [Pseudomonadota bacterium]